MPRWDGHTKQDTLDTIARKRAKEKKKRQAASASRPAKPKPAKAVKVVKPKHEPVTPAPPDPRKDALFRYDRFSNPNADAKTEAQGHPGALPADIEKLILAYGPMSDLAKRSLETLLRLVPFGASTLCRYVINQDPNLPLARIIREHEEI